MPTTLAFSTSGTEGFVAVVDHVLPKLLGADADLVAVVGGLERRARAVPHREPNEVLVVVGCVVGDQRAAVDDFLTDSISGNRYHRHMLFPGAVRIEVVEVKPLLVLSLIHI